MKQSPLLRLSVRSQMLVEKMNAFYLKNWDKEAVFDIAQRVMPRRERHWHGKQSPKTTGALKNWKYTYTHTPYHKSDDGQSPGDILTKNPKKKYFWVDPPADYFLDKNHPGGQRDFHLAWSEFYEELEKAAYAEPEQVLTLLTDLSNEGWTVDASAFEKADAMLEQSRERRVLGIKPPILLQKVKGKERWPGALPVFEEEWDPIRPYTYYSQANPAWSYKPIMESDWVHDPAPWKDGELPPPQITQWEDKLLVSKQRQNVLLQAEADDRFKQLLDGQNKDLYAQWERDPTSFAGDPQEIKWLTDASGQKRLDDQGVPLMLHTDINHFFERFYFGEDLAELLFFFKYTSDHIKLRHYVFEKTGKTLLEYTEPERFAILHAVLELRKEVLQTDMGKQLLQCYTDQDYIDVMTEDAYRQFLRLEGRKIDEERRRYLRLWSTEVAQEERLDQVVELTRMRQEDEYQTGIYGGVARVKDRMDRKKWAIKEPSRQVQEHEKLVSETIDERRALFEDEMAGLTEEARLSYGDEVYGRMAPAQRITESGRQFTPESPLEPNEYENPDYKKPE